MNRVRDNDASLFERRASLGGFERRASLGGRKRCTPRIGLPLCFGASLTLHAVLMAMSSVWVSGADVDARRASAVESDEVDAIAISVRIPQGGDGGDAIGDARVAGGGDETLRKNGSGSAIESEDGASRDSGEANGDEQARAGDAQLADAADPNAARELTTVAAMPFDTAIDGAPSDAHIASSFVPMDDGNVSADLVASRAPESPATTTPGANEPQRDAFTVLPFAPYVLPALSSPAPAPTSRNAQESATIAPSHENAPNTQLADASAHDAEQSKPASSSEDRTTRTPIDRGADSAQPSSSEPSSAAVAGAAAVGAIGSGAGSGASIHDANAGSGGAARSGADGEGAGSSASGRGAGAVGPVAVITFAPRPEYPLSAVRHGEQGRVLCALHVDVAGGVTRVEVLRSSGHAVLDRAATDALARWRFEPARDNGRPVPCRIPHWVTFRLE